MAGTIRPIITVAHAAFDAARVEAFAPLRASLEEQCSSAGIELFIYEDHEAKGSLTPWLRCLEYAAASNATHVTSLPDDAVLVPHFVEVLREAIAAQPEAILCFQSNNEKAAKARADGFAWYTTSDGFTGFGGTMPIAWAGEYLEWRRTALKPDVLVQADEGVNFWAMATGRLIYKSLPSLVDHDLTLPSLDGNDHHAALSPRRPVSWEPGADLRGHDWSGPVKALGRTYRGNHWRLTTDLREPLIERAFEVNRGGPVSASPMVYVATPCYGGQVFADYCQATHRVASDLVAHEIGCSFDWGVADSLITRGRNRLVYRFLTSPATHLLFWDADVVPEDPTLARRMLETGCPIIGGAYPFKDQTGRVVASFWPDQEIEVQRGTVEVMDVPTGFLLIARHVIVDLIRRHPEIAYASDNPHDRGFPQWALFDGGIVKGRYLSEDYLFCHRAQEAGYVVRCMVDATFRHIGSCAYRGNFAEAHGIETGTTPCQDTGRGANPLEHGGE